jgi:hypothetical protein
VAARSKVWTVFARKNTRIVSSNPTLVMDICVGLFRAVVFCVQGAALRRAHPPSKESYWLCKRMKKPKKGPNVQQRAVEP